MSNILEIGYIEYSEQTKRVNWNQLLRARADNPNLRIYVQPYNKTDSTGAQNTFIATKIMIVDYNTNDVYFTVFAEILQTSESMIPVSASPDADRIIDMINSYGFNVRLSEPTPVTDRVLTILRGLYAAGYRYVRGIRRNMADKRQKNDRQCVEHESRRIQHRDVRAR